MKTFLLILLIVLLTTEITAQQKLKFTYDTAGNQILRDRVCATCLKAMLPTAIDSIADALLKDNREIPGASLNFGVMIFPNPVSQNLFVNWEPNAPRQPVKLFLFTMDNKILAVYVPKKGQLEQEIDFTPYPPAMYILEILFNNGEQKSFKVIKDRP